MDLKRAKLIIDHNSWSIDRDALEEAVEVLEAIKKALANHDPYDHGDSYRVLKEIDALVNADSASPSNLGESK
jgi:hypothetical protein